jgi:hypothetical protein
MKIRCSFVSNSSTSSFILSAKDDAALKVSFLGSEVDLAVYAEEPDGRILRSVAELDGLMDEVFSWWVERLDTDARQTLWYLRSRASLEAGRIVVFGEIPTDNGSDFENACYEFGLQAVLVSHADIEVINCEG